MLQPIKYNREVFERIMVWPGYLTKDIPAELSEIKKKCSADFAADGRKYEAEIVKEVRFKSRTTALLRLVFESDGYLRFYISGRTSNIPKDVVLEWVNWAITSAWVFSQYGLI